jgi:hypothetical protein
MDKAKINNRVIGLIGIFFGLICFGSFLVGNNEKLIIPTSNLFITKYFVVISIINAGYYFIIAGLLGFFGIFSTKDSKPEDGYKKLRAKLILLSIILLSPFLVSFFTTLFVMSETFIWKLMGSLAIIYISYMLFENFKVVIKK